MEERNNIVIARRYDVAISAMNPTTRLPHFASLRSQWQILNPWFFTLLLFPPKLTPGEKTYLRIKVTTKQPKTEYISTLDDGTIKIRLRAVPEKGRANEELTRFLAEILGIRKDSIEIIAGASDTKKLVRVG